MGTALESTGANRRLQRRGLAVGAGVLALSAVFHLAVYVHYTGSDAPRQIDSRAVDLLATAGAESRGVAGPVLDRDLHDRLERVFAPNARSTPEERHELWYADLDAAWTDARTGTPEDRE